MRNTPALLAPRVCTAVLAARPVPDEPSPTTSSATPPAASPGAGTSGMTVDPNTATPQQPSAAPGEAGVDNPDQGAREAQEYRPYTPYTSGNLQPVLTQELGRYVLSQDRLSKVPSTLKVG